MAPSSPSRSSDNEDTCYVFWKTESILSNSSASLPIPSLAAQTPTKRSTTIAALPSPSTSTTTAKPARFSKRRRPALKSEKSEGMDEATLKTMGVLAARLSGRSSSGGSLGRGEVLRDKTGDKNLVWIAGDKGKGKEVDRGPQGGREGSRSTTLGAQRSLPPPGGLPTPVSRSTSLLALSRSKPFVNNHSKLPSPITPLAAAPVLSKINSAPVPAAEEEEDEFDSFYPPDDSFDLALSQLDVLAAVPVPSLSRIKPTAIFVPKLSTPSLPRVVAPPTRASPRLAPRPAPKVLPPKPAAPRLVAPRTTATLIPARSAIPQPRAAVPAPPVPAARPAVVVAKGPAFRFAAAAKKEVVIRGAGGKEMEEMAKRELEALEAEGGGDWSDGSF